MDGFDGVERSYSSFMPSVRNGKSIGFTISYMDGANHHPGEERFQKLCAATNVCAAHNK
jgi:hypothetical protein